MDGSANSAARRLAAISDLHGFLPEIPACDLLLVGGDLCPISDHGPEHQRRWLEGPFADWLGGLQAAAVVGIAGNHDFVAEDDPDLMRRLPWLYLCDESIEVDGLTVHGSPWTPMFGDWAFMRDDHDLGRVWAGIPESTDVLLTHGPPLGHGDRTAYGVDVGSASLLRRLPALERLRLHVFGHIHEGGGSRTELGGATLANVSHVDFAYRPAHPATLFEL